MSKSSLDKYLGAYKGVPIRCKPSGLINITDIHKANGAPSSLRPDKWLSTPKTQEILQSLAQKANTEPVLDKFRNIKEVSNVLEVFRGGDRLGQGTFAGLELALLYAESLSSDCENWLSEVLKTFPETEIPSQVTEDVHKTIKVSRKDISLGQITLDVFQLPNGSYILSQDQTATTIGNNESNVRSFLGSNSPEALPYKGFTPAKYPVEGEKTRINGIPVSLAVAYWTKQALDGNSIATRLLAACAVESIERRADKVFGVTKTESEYNYRFEEVFKAVIATLPETSSLSTSKDLVRVSAPLQRFYSKIQAKLKKAYTKSGLLGRTKDYLRKEIAFLASYCPIIHWKLTPQQELNYQLGDLSKTKYPDLTSGIVPFSIDGKQKTAVFMFQIYDFIVTHDNVSDCALKRRYVQIAKESMGVDYAYLFLVAPFGATPSAASFVEECLPDGANGSRGFVGIITLKEMLEFYRKQALDTRSQNPIKGKIKKKFDDLLNYEIPTSPFELFLEEHVENYIQLSLLPDDKENE